MFSKITTLVIKGAKETYLSMNYLFSSIFVLIFRLLIFYFLWLSIAGKGVAQNVLAYIILTQVFWFSSPKEIVRKINEEVQKGVFDLRLLKPISVLKQYLLEDLGKSLANFSVLFLLLYGLFFFLVRSEINLIFLFIGFALSFLSYYFIFFTIGLLVFWFGDSYPIFWIVSKLLMIAQLIPHHYIPSPFQAIFDLLPGKYAVYYPAMIVLNGKIYAEPIFYCISLFILSTVTLKFALKKLSVFGG